MKRLIDYSLYLVTDRGRLDMEDFLRVVAASVEGGVSIVQLREKESSARAMISIGRRLLSLLRPVGVPLIINDRVDVAHAIGADGVHLGQSDLPVADARKILGDAAIIGLSVESLEQAQEASIEDIDYLAASPIFNTKTKADCSPPWGLKDLRQLCACSTLPVIAIGGINASNAQQVMDCGVAGMAVVSAIFNASCPKDTARMLKTITFKRK